MCVDDWHMCKWARQGCFLRPKEPHGADMGRYMGDAKQPATGAPKQSVTSRSREFCSFLDGTGPGTGKKLVPEKSTGTGTGKNWSRKKVPVPVSEKIGPSTVEFPGTPGHCIF